MGELLLATAALGPGGAHVSKWFDCVSALSATLEAHTTPQQEDLPMFDKKSARVVPGVGNDDAAKAGKPAVKVV